MVPTVREFSRMTLRFPAVVIGKMTHHQQDGTYWEKSLRETEFHLAPRYLR